jgi:integrase
VASITQTGPKSWRALIRRKGHPTLCRTFKTEKEARTFAKRAEAEIVSGKTIRKGGMTVADAVDAFRALREQGRRPVKPTSNEEYMLRHLADPDGIGDVEIERLTPQKIAEWCRLRADDGAGPYTVGMEISKLATVMKYAAISLHAVLPDVVGAARPLLEYSGLIGPGQARTRRPTPDELDRVLEQLGPQMQDLVRFAIATAMRRAEICRVLWADVDEDRRLILIRDRKHPKRTKGNHQLVPLVDRTGFDAWAILKRQPRLGDRIFPLSPEFVSDSFTAACRAAGVENLHFHDMRHEGTSRLFEAGMTIEQVSIITGHADWRNLKRYTNLKPESLHGTRPDTPPRPDSPRSVSRHPHTSEP